MGIQLTRVDNFGVVATKEVNGKIYYSIADILEKVNIKPAGLGIIPNIPIQISGEIVWGYRSIGMNFIEAVFIDEDGMDKLIKIKG